MMCFMLRFDMSSLMSCVYAMFVVVIGASLSLAEVSLDNMSIGTFEASYSMVYLVHL